MPVEIREVKTAQVSLTDGDFATFAEPVILEYLIKQAVADSDCPWTRRAFYTAEAQKAAEKVMANLPMLPPTAYITPDDTVATGSLVKVVAAAALGVDAASIIEVDKQMRSRWRVTYLTRGEDNASTSP